MFIPDGLLRDPGGDRFRRPAIAVRPPSGAVPIEAMTDVGVLLEVAPMGEVDERLPVRGELHRVIGPHCTMARVVRRGDRPAHAPAMIAGVLR